MGRNSYQILIVEPKLLHFVNSTPIIRAGANLSQLPNVVPAMNWWDFFRMRRIANNSSHMRELVPNSHTGEEFVDSF